MKVLILTVIFFVVSLSFSTLGMGGGMFYVPLLLFAKVSIHDAGTLSLGLIMITSLSALVVFMKNKLVDWKLAAIIDPPTDIMAFVGGYFSSYISEPILKMILVCVLITAGLFMFKKGQPNPLCPQTKRWWCWHRNFNGMEYKVNLLLTLPVTAGIGVISGMIGITGGVIKLPLMVLFCGVPMDIAIATSTVMVAVTALFGFGGRLLTGHLDYSTFIPLVIAAFIGGQIGSRISIKSNKAVLKVVFGVLLLLIAVKFIIELVR